MARFRKKPVAIEAIRYRPGPGGNCDEVAAFISDPAAGPHRDETCDPQASWYIDTLEGLMEARPGDWIIRGVKGELYPCKPDIFDATYEPAD